MGKSRIIRTAQCDVHYIADGITFVKRLSNDGNCWIYHVCFGELRATAYRIPSHIPHSEVGRVNWERKDRGYYRNGQFHAFGERIRAAYESSALGVE